MTGNIILSFDEGIAAATVGCVQMMRAIQKGWVGNDHGGASGRELRERWAQSIHGALAEYAVCKFLNVCWTPSIDGINRMDALGYQIRATPWADGHLVINGGEPEKYAGQKFILITGHWPAFTVKGWIQAEESSRAEWWRANERPPSFWIPQRELLPIGALNTAER